MFSSISCAGGFRVSWPLEMMRNMSDGFGARSWLHLNSLAKPKRSSSRDSKKQKKLDKAQPQPWTLQLTRTTNARDSIIAYASGDVSRFRLPVQFHFLLPDAARAHSCWRRWPLCHGHHVVSGARGLRDLGSQQPKFHRSRVEVAGTKICCDELVRAIALRGCCLPDRVDFGARRISQPPVHARARRKDGREFLARCLNRSICLVHGKLW